MLTESIKNMHFSFRMYALTQQYQISYRPLLTLTFQIVIIYVSAANLRFKKEYLEFYANNAIMNQRN